MTLGLPELRSGPIALAALACTVALGGCGSSFDSAASGEHLIRDYVKKFGNGKVTIKSLSCPAGVAHKAGRSYDCTVVLHDTATGSNHPGTITVHIRRGNKVELQGSRDIHLR